jgi:hypothetical protein
MKSPGSIESGLVPNNDSEEAVTRPCKAGTRVDLPCRSSGALEDSNAFAVNETGGTLRPNLRCSEKTALLASHTARCRSSGQLLQKGARPEESEEIFAGLYKAE